MSNKAAIDFGNSNTVLAIWNDTAGAEEVLHIPEYSAPGSFLIPSQIAYEPDGRFFVGAQCSVKASPDSKEFRWMKRYLSLRSPYTLRVGEKRIDARRAAEDYLQAVIAASFTDSDAHPDELMVSVPVESFEHYSEWLLNEMTRIENMRIRLIDEATAAAAGYGLRLHPGDTLLVLDFGGSTLQSAVVSVAEDGSNQGRCCRVLGKAGTNLGGMTLDRWVFEMALNRMSLAESDSDVHNNSGALLRYCEEIKKALSVQNACVFDFFPDRSFAITRNDLDKLFMDHGLFDSLDLVLDEAIRSAEDHGLVRDQLTAMVPVGGSCLLPSIGEHLETRFPAEKIAFGEPLGAVARGAAIIAGGMNIYDFIQHDYAIRYTDSQTGNYSFKIIIPKGTSYPSLQVTPLMRLKAAYQGQSRFGIAIYELHDGSSKKTSSNEIFFDETGAAHVLPLTEDEVRAEQMFWMNERNPLFIDADEPCEKGMPCYEIYFGINENKMLTVNATELKTQKVILNSFPVIRLN